MSDRRAHIAVFWSRWRPTAILAFMAAVMSFFAVASLSDGLTATHDAAHLRDYGVVATVDDVRIHVSDNQGSSRRTPKPQRAPVENVEVVFTDPQGQQRAERLSSFIIHGAIPRASGWTTQFEGHDRFLGKEFLFLPDQPGNAQMRDQMQSTLDHGYDRAPTYIGIGIMVLALLFWALTFVVARAKYRSRGAGVRA